MSRRQKVHRPFAMPASHAAEGIEAALQGVSYTAGASALVAVFARWIAERSKDTDADVMVWTGALEVLTHEIHRIRVQAGVDAAA